MERSLSLIVAVRPVTIASGEMLVGDMILHRWRSTRSLADKRSVGNAGKGMPVNLISCKHEADPPKNPSGRIGTLEIGTLEYGDGSNASRRRISAGNGRCIITATFVS